MKKFIKEIFTDERGSYSSKRFLGILCIFSLLLSLIMSSFVESDFRPSDSLINAIALFSFGSLGLTSIDKWSFKKGI